MRARSWLGASLLTLAIGCELTPATTAPSPSDDAPDGSAAASGGGPTHWIANDGAAATDLLPANAFFPTRASPIVQENQLPGWTGWQLAMPSGGLAAYADATSALPGAMVNVHAAAGAPMSARWELLRLGYYAGARGRLVASGGPVSVPAATPPLLDSSTGMVTAGWPATFALPIPADAPTGYYLIKLCTADAQTYAPLIVREAQPGAPILIDIAVGTYQAYNAWGGTSLYDNRRADFGGPHAYAVSFDRPYAQGNGAGQLFYADRDLITFVEAQGYDVGYVTDQDLDRDPSLLAHRRLLVVQGHSEYWSGTMRANVEAALDDGTSLAFFGANNVYWQVRWSADRRSIIGYKDRCAQDPLMASAPEQATCRFRDLATPRPENALVGIMFGEWQATAAPMRISDETAWLWTGTGASTGALVPGLFGFESDRRYANGAEPAGVVELGAALVENHSAEVALAQATLYVAPSGATVFASATTDWSRLLAHDGLWDARMQQATANLFSRLAGDGTLGPSVLQPFTLGPGPVQPAYRAGVTVSTVTSSLTSPVALTVAPNGDAIVVDGNRIVRVTPAGVVSVIAGSASTGFTDGPAATAAFAGPRGVALRSDGGIYMSDSSNHKIRLILNGMVSTVAGVAEGFSDGPATVAKLDTPMAIGLHPSGLLLVADAWNHRVRAVDAAGRVSTWAGDGNVNVKDGPGTQAEFNFPFALAVRSDGTALIVDGETGLVRLMANDAAHTVSTFAGQLGRSGWQDGPLASASVMEILAVASRPNGETLLIDGATWRVRALGAGTVDTLAGGATSSPVDGAGASAGFQLPHAAAAAPDGTVLVADTGNHALRRLIVR